MRHLIAAMPGPVMVGLFVVVLALAYAGSCIVRPFRDCWVCDGKGHHRSKSNRKLSRPCRWCRGKGKRLRIGRKMWNRFAKVRKAAS